MQTGSVSPAALRLMQVAFRESGPHAASALMRELVPLRSVQPACVEAVGDTLSGLLRGEPAASLDDTSALLSEVESRIKIRHGAFLDASDLLQLQWVSKDQGVVAVGLNVLRGDNPCAGVTAFIAMTDDSSPAELYISPLGNPRVRTDLLSPDGNLWNHQFSHVRV